MQDSLNIKFSLSCDNFKINFIRKVNTTEQRVDPTSFVTAFSTEAEGSQHPSISKGYCKMLKWNGINHYLASRAKSMH